MLKQSSGLDFFFNALFSNIENAMQTFLGDGPGGCSSEKLKRLNQDIDVLVEEVWLP